MHKKYKRVGRLPVFRRGRAKPGISGIRDDTLFSGIIQGIPGWLVVMCY